MLDGGVVSWGDYRRMVRLSRYAAEQSRLTLEDPEGLVEDFVGQLGLVVGVDDVVGFWKVQERVAPESIVEEG
jgi:hypothetical protein